jgi:hypothetical protein
MGGLQITQNEKTVSAMAGLAFVHATSLQRTPMLLNFSLTAATRSDIFWTRIGGGLVVVLCGLLMSTVTQAQTDGVLAKLKRNEKLSCKPLEPNFCLNMHVSCAGKTNYQAFDFNLQANEKNGDLTVAKKFDQYSDLYASANVQWSADNAYIILTPAKGKGYVKMFDNGKYIFRYYPVNQEGIMSLGKCE